MKFDKETVAKHHFWFLLGGLFIPVLLMVIGVIGVSGAAADAAAKNEADKKKVDTAASNAKGIGELNAKRKQKGSLGGTADVLWNQGWNFQQSLFAWPTQAKFVSRFELKEAFGEEYAGDMRDVFRDNSRRIYLNAYREFPGIVAPTRIDPSAVLGLFPPDLATEGGVPPWETLTPTNEQLWLTMENFWVRRELVRIIARINDRVATLTNEGPDGKTLPEGTFRSPVWEMTFKVDAGGGRVTGTYKNLTPRLQFLGKERSMRVALKFDNGKDVEFEIQGKPVPAGSEAIDIPEVDANKDRLVGKLEGATRVVAAKQIFDELTVPVKKIEAVELFKTGSRTITKTPLKEAVQFKKDEADAAAAGGTSYAQGQEGVGGYGGEIAGAGTGGSTGAAGASGADEAPADGLIKRRYTAAREQVRRLPIGVSLLIDQAFVAEVMTEFANSKLLFQITQVHWSRFQGVLDIPSELADRAGSPNDPTGGAAGGRVPFAGSAGGEGREGLEGLGGGRGVGTAGEADGPLTFGKFSDSLISYKLYGTATLYQKKPEAKKKDEDGPAQ